MSENIKPIIYDGFDEYFPEIGFLTTSWYSFTDDSLTDLIYASSYCWLLGIFSIPEIK